MIWLVLQAWAADGYVVPNVAVDTDDGFGAGARAEVAWPSDDKTLPYRLSLVAQAYVAVSGYQHHRVRIDRVGFGPNDALRLTAHLAWRQWLSDGYFGIGNGTIRDRTYVGSFDRDDVDRRRYQYGLFQPFAHVTLRVALGETPVELFVAVNPKWSAIRVYEGSLLAEERPYGLAGGPTVQGFAGVLHDTRAPEVAPRHGHLLEASVRAAPDLGGEAGGFGGALVSARGYGAVSSRAVLAGRVMAEHLLGTVPFYELVHWGGAIPIAGFGGPETLRGATFGRWRAPGKAIANGEVRVAVAEVAVKGDPVVFEVAPYVDVGAVYGAGQTKPPFPLHPAAGGGIRVVYAETFVGRVDSGVAVDPVREADGGVTQAVAFGFYLTFDHPF